MRSADFTSALVAATQQQHESHHWVAIFTLILAAIGAAGTIIYVGLTWGLLRAAKDDIKKRTELDGEAQARQIGGYLKGNEGVLSLVIVNTSKLPVRAVHGYAVAKHTDTKVASFESIAVLEPGEQIVGLAPPHQTFNTKSGGEVDLRLIFDDDNGTTWIKYGRTTPLEMHNRTTDRIG